MKETKVYISIFLFAVLVPFLNCCANSQSIYKEYEFVMVAGGNFSMGCENGEDSEKPIHIVSIDDFKIGKYEVTNAQYCEFLNEKSNRNGEGGTWIYLEKSKVEKKGNNYVPKSGFENHPVVSISWEGANEFAKWKGARLPTEAEWEYAAKGGTLSKGYSYSGSNQINEVAWFEGNSENRTHTTGQKKPNELGIYDMSGNVWEWCNDWYSEEYYESSPIKNPQGPDFGTAKVLRGGELEFNERYCRVDKRYNISPHARNTRIGFRLAKDSD